MKEPLKFYSEPQRGPLNDDEYKTYWIYIDSISSNEQYGTILYNSGSSYVSCDCLVNSCTLYISNNVNYLWNYIPPNPVSSEYTTYNLHVIKFVSNDSTDGILKIYCNYNPNIHDTTSVILFPPETSAEHPFIWVQLSMKPAIQDRSYDEQRSYSYPIASIGQNFISTNCDQTVIIDGKTCCDDLVFDIQKGEYSGSDIFTYMSNFKLCIDGQFESKEYNYTFFQNGSDDAGDPTQRRYRLDKNGGYKDFDITKHTPNFFISNISNTYHFIVYNCEIYPKAIQCSNTMYLKFRTITNEAVRVYNMDSQLITDPALTKYVIANVKNQGLLTGEGTTLLDIYPVIPVEQISKYSIIYISYKINNDIYIIWRKLIRVATKTNNITYIQIDPPLFKNIIPLQISGSTLE